MGPGQFQYEKTIDILWGGLQNLFVALPITDHMQVVSSHGYQEGRQIMVLS